MKKSAIPLLEKDMIQQGYVDGMIDSVKEHGPYIVIAPDIAIPHARPELGSKKIGFSFMRLQEAVSFRPEGEQTASLFIALSCVDNKTHMKLLQKIVMILSDESKLEKLYQLNDKTEIVSLFND